MGLRMNVRGRLSGQLGVFALAAYALSACGGSSPEPVRSASGPPLVVDTSAADAGAFLQVAPSAAAPLPPKDEPAAVPAPLPATTKLARGNGSRADAALQAGDAAYDADDFALAETKYREASTLAPKDGAPLVGLARVAIAKTNLPTDYNAAPKHPLLEKTAAQLRQAIKLDPQFAPAHTELGRALLMLGKADDALVAFRKAIELLSSTGL